MRLTTALKPCRTRHAHRLPPADTLVPAPRPLSWGAVLGAILEQEKGKPLMIYSNPCGNATGCPSEDLAQAILSSANAAAQRMDPHPPLPGTNKGSSTSTGVIVGAAIGGCAILVIAIALVWWARRRKNRKLQAMRTDKTSNGPLSPRRGDKNSYYQDTPPTCLNIHRHLHTAFNNNHSLKWSSMKRMPVTRCNRFVGLCQYRRVLPTAIRVTNLPSQG